MVSLKTVENQLKQIGFNFHTWGRGEVKELCNILSDGEVIKQCANGYYEGGFAMLVATDQRLILVDRKPVFLNMEAIWYDKIGQIDFNHRLINASIRISSPNKEVRFTSLNHDRLRKILAFSQEKMIAAKEGEKAEEGERKAEASMNLVDNSRQPEFGGRFASGLSAASFPAPAQSMPSQPYQANEFPLPRYSDQPSERLKIYTASRLPFSRRRYFAPSTK